ncbi:MAG: hypothetical protein KAQ68_06500 [Clostridiales bacterium]|nr:hypothetical protein [Clostridiales bacterium]
MTEIFNNIIKRTNDLIAFINWNGAPFKDKKRKVIKELSAIRAVCKQANVE